MGDTAGSTQTWTERWANERYAYLTTTGRVSGRQHRIEIWFAVHEGNVYMLAGSRDRADWVRNLRKNPRVSIQLGDETRSAVARVLDDGTSEDQLARELLVSKYRNGDDLKEWGANSLAIAMDVE